MIEKIYFEELSVVNDYMLTWHGSWLSHAIAHCMSIPVSVWGESVCIYAGRNTRHKDRRRYQLYLYIHVQEECMLMTCRYVGFNIIPIQVLLKQHTQLYTRNYTRIRNENSIQIIHPFIDEFTCFNFFIFLNFLWLILMDWFIQVIIDDW